MSITAKELARKLNLSQTAVSMALNNKPGVSTETAGGRSCGKIRLRLYQTFSKEK